VYATEYMHADSAYTRFFGTMNFFTGSMFGFVLASNLFMAFIFWELLGFSSYLLIGYYWPKPSASSAAKKAFLYNKVGDVSFMVGIALVWTQTLNLGTPTLDYHALYELAHAGTLTVHDMMIPGLLIFGGAIGKSAQFPLFGWLPEAMEGPTPVSSLLHSSTMVKAGLFLTARVFFMFYEVDDALEVISKPLFAANVIAWAGTLTALAGGLMALTATDIKKVLAFSTISQLGYIGLALGAGGLTASFFHLIAHATFKSLLFLGAGAVIHSVHSQEMSDMGGLKDKMKTTYRTMAIGLIGLSGFPLSSGFWSKDAVLLSMESSQIVGHVFLYWIGVITATITAFYSTKLLLLTFHGEPKYDKDHVHPAPTGKRMQFALWLLAGLVVLESLWWTWTIGGSFLAEAPGPFALSGKNFEFFLGSVLGQHGGEFEILGALISSLAVFLGIFLAWMLYAKHSFKFLQTNPVNKTMYQVSERRFFLDEFIYWFAENPIMMVGDAFQATDKQFIDGIVINGIVAGGSLKVASMSDDFDQGVIDGVVNGLGNFARNVARQFRRLQTGQTPNYALLMALGLGVVLTIFTVITFL